MVEVNPNIKCGDCKFYHCHIFLDDTKEEGLDSECSNAYSDQYERPVMLEDSCGKGIYKGFTYGTKYHSRNL